MEGETTFESLEKRLRNDHLFNNGSIELLKDKGLFTPDEAGKFDELKDICDAMDLPIETFAERRKKKSRFDRILDEGDSPEITTGRYARYTRGFSDISSEQALMQARLMGSIEYIIALADEVGGSKDFEKFVPRKYTDNEKALLRLIYEDYRTRDFIAIKAIEKKTDHDIVAPNTWIAIRAQQLSLNGSLVRGLTHFARTSADLNSNISGMLYAKAHGKWMQSLVKVVTKLKDRAELYKKSTCIAETHGQDAQLTTLGYIYGNLAEQIRQHSKAFLGPDKFRLEGKIAGAIGTDADMTAGLPGRDFSKMYEKLLHNVYGLNQIELGVDQDSSNAAFCDMLNTLADISLVIQKAATDTWIYASRGILTKAQKKGMSGSSAMPQKVNPFFAESAEALLPMIRAVFEPLKANIVAYREQGDLRRSITMREGFHYFMLGIIALERLSGELDRYAPYIPAMEAEIYAAGPKIASSVISNRLRVEGVEDAYDVIKSVVMRPVVKPYDIGYCLIGLKEGGRISAPLDAEIQSIMVSVMDNDGNMDRFNKCKTEDEMRLILTNLQKINCDVDRRAKLLGSAVEKTENMIKNAADTIDKLMRYAA